MWVREQVWEGVGTGAGTGTDVGAGAGVGGLAPGGWAALGALCWKCLFRSSGSGLVLGAVLTTWRDP